MRYRPQPTGIASEQLRLWNDEMCRRSNSKVLMRDMMTECTRSRIEFTQQMHRSFLTKPYIDPALLPINVGVYSIRITPTVYCIAGGANDPLCFEIRNLQVIIKSIFDMTEIV